MLGDLSGKVKLGEKLGGLECGTGDRMAGRVCSRGYLMHRIGWVGLREGKAGDQEEEGAVGPPGSHRS